MWALFENTDYPKTESIWTLNRLKLHPNSTMSIIWMADYTQLHHDNGYGFPAVESFQWLYANTDRVEVEKGFPKFTFQYTQSATKVLGNDFQFSKIDFKTEFEKKYLNGKKQIYFSKQVLP
jgi:hypothetical protein